MSEAIKIPTLKKDFLLKLKARLEQKKRDIKIITSPDPDSNVSDNKPEQERQGKPEEEGCSRDSVGHDNDKDTNIAGETSNSNPLDSNSDSGLHGNSTVESEIKSAKDAELEMSKVSKENEGDKRKSGVSSSSESESSENIIRRKNKKSKIPRRSSSNSSVFSKSKLENFDTTRISSNTKAKVISPASSVISSVRKYSELDDDHSGSDEDSNKISKLKKHSGKGKSHYESLDSEEDKHKLQEIHGYLICCIMLTSLLESQSLAIDAQTFKMLKAMQSELGQAISVFFMKDLGSKSKLVEEIAEEMFERLTADDENDDDGLFQVFGIDLTQRHCSEALFIVFNSNPADPSMLHRLRAQGSFQYLQDIHTIYKTGFAKGK